MLLNPPSLNEIRIDLLLYIAVLGGGGGGEGSCDPQDPPGSGHACFILLIDQGLASKMIVRSILHYVPQCETPKITLPH